MGGLYCQVHLAPLPKILRHRSSSFIFLSLSFTRSLSLSPPQLHLPFFLFMSLLPPTPWLSVHCLIFSLPHLSFPPQLCVSVCVIQPPTLNACLSFPRSSYIFLPFFINLSFPFHPFLFHSLPLCLFTSFPLTPFFHSLSLSLSLSASLLVLPLSFTFPPYFSHHHLSLCLLPSLSLFHFSV